MGRLGHAFRCFFWVLRGKPLAELALARDPSALPAAPPLAPGGDYAVQVLGLLQKEGRLLDFLFEDIDNYSDAQVGTAVRTIHAACRRTLQENFVIEPVLSGQEDDPVTVAAGFDPSSIRLIGNVSGEPPFKGLLRHHGWRATAVNLPNLPQEGDRRVVAAAEVEVA